MVDSIHCRASRSRAGSYRALALRASSASMPKSFTALMIAPRLVGQVLANSISIRNWLKTIFDRALHTGHAGRTLHS